MPATYDGARALASAAARLEGERDGLPALFFLTDPDRIKDPLAAAAGLRPGSGVILRHFGRPDQIALAADLARICRSGGHVFLIAADPQLARRSGADGVHWPAAQIASALRWRRREPRCIMTASAHDPSELRRAARLADAALLSPVFPSDSPSAGRPLGPWRAGALARRAAVPVYALGGVTPRRAKRLRRLGFSGVAAVDAAASSDR